MLHATPEIGAAEARVMDAIDDLKNKLRLNLHEPRRWIGSLRRLAFARAIQGSNSIEGYDAALDDAAAVALGEEPLDANDETRLALAGYRDAMTYVLQLATDADDDFTYSAQLIKALHFMMTRHSLNNNPGQWRPRGIFVRKEQTGEIVYEGPERDVVPSLMAELVDQLNDDDGTPPLVRAAMAHLNLVMIHPFRDGNGRMARCAQSLVLARGGLLSPVFMSIEEYLGANTDSYYTVLAEVGQGRWNPQRDARAWLRFSLTAHLRQARTTLRRVKEGERLWIELEHIAENHSALPERAISALFDAASGLRVRNSTYRAGLKDAGEEITMQTAARDLGQLVRLGLLTARGKARGRIYVAGQDLIKLRESVSGSRDPRDDSDPFAVQSN
jgi:Fic family protein